VIRRLAAIALALLALAQPWGLAHGVRHSVSEGAMVVTATYDDESPMVFCDVSVFSPADPADPYQTGGTDPRGRFAFVPDTNGLWRVTVDDGMGHAMTAEVNVDSGSVGSAESAEKKLGRPMALVIGLCLIFGLFGIYSLARQATRHTQAGSGCGEEGCACTSPKV
jgi:nickel transport protein